MGTPFYCFSINVTILNTCTYKTCSQQQFYFCRIEVRRSQVYILYSIFIVIYLHKKYMKNQTYEMDLNI